MYKYKYKYKYPHCLYGLKHIEYNQQNQLITLSLTNDWWTLVSFYMTVTYFDPSQNRDVTKGPLEVDNGKTKSLPIPLNASNIRVHITDNFQTNYNYQYTNLLVNVCYRAELIRGTIRTHVVENYGSLQC